ncbi:hypothetical protein ACFL4W_05480 [Planctomycetota bacterium]
MKQLFVILLVIGFSASIFADSVGGPALDTGDSIHPGIGKFRTIQDCINAAYAADGNPATDRGKVEALWKWLSLNLVHGANRAREDINNSAMTSEQAMGCYDTSKYLLSYGYTICYASSSAMVGIWEAAGFEARGRAVGDHTVPEVFYNGDYHYYDADMGGTCFEADHSTIASVDEVAANDSLFGWDYRTGGYDWPYFPWDGIGTMQACFNRADPYRYNDYGTAVHPSTLNLRRGESFVRYFNYDRAPWGAGNAHWAGLSHGGFPAGPARIQGFVYDPPVNGTNNGLARAPYVSDGLVRYGNGVFEWTPNLEDDTITDGTESITSVAWGASSPRLHGDGATGEVIIPQWTPYVIAGNPGSTTFTDNPTDAIVISGSAYPRMMAIPGICGR